MKPKVSLIALALGLLLLRQEMLNVRKREFTVDFCIQAALAMLL